MTRTVGRATGHLFARAATLGVAWWALTGGDGADLGIGVASVALAVAASEVLLPGPRLSPAALPGFLLFFLGQSVRGGLQVAALALDPRRAPRPALVAFPLRLPEGPARVAFACALTLLPGTLAVGVDGDLLVIHVLDATRPVERLVRATERHVARLIGAELA